MKDKPTSQSASDGMLEFYKTMDKYQEDQIDFLHNYILKRIDNTPRIWTGLELDVHAMDSNLPEEKALVKRCLDLSEKLREAAELPPHRTFFMQNPRGELIFCLKLTEPPSEPKKEPKHLSISYKKED